MILNTDPHCQGRTVHKGTGGARGPQALGWGTDGGTAIGVSANALILNGNRSVKTDIC